MLDAVVVGTPGGDAALDLVAGQVFCGGALGESGEFGVGCEAQGDELREGDGVDEAELIFGQEVGEAELLFEADDAILCAEGGHAADAGHGKEDQRHGDPPEVRVLECGPSVNGRVDREDEVEQKHGDDEEVKRRVVARVVFVGLWLSHEDDDSAVVLR